MDCRPTGSVKGFVNVTVQQSESPGLFIWYGHCHEVDNHLSDQHLKKKNGIKSHRKYMKRLLGKEPTKGNLNVDTVELRSTDNCLIRTPGYCREFHLSRRGKPRTLSLKLTRLIRTPVNTLWHVP